MQVTNKHTLSSPKTRIIFSYIIHEMLTHFDLEEKALHLGFSSREKYRRNVSRFSAGHFYDLI